MAQYIPAAQHKLRKAVIGDAREEISILYHQYDNKKITWDQYCRRRIPFLKILGTFRIYYDKDGKSK